MRDLSFLTAPHEPQDAPGLETSDERLAEVSALADLGDYEAAADRVQALVEEEVFDIRLLVFLLYQAFFEEGLDALKTGLLGIPEIMALDVVGPSTRRDSQVARSLRWWLEKTVDALEYHEDKETEAWGVWSAKLTPKLCSETLGAMKAAIENAGDATSTETLEVSARLTRWLRNAEARMSADLEPEMSEDGEEETSETAAPTEAKIAAPTGGYEVRGSQKLMELARKLEAFEELVSRKSFEKAALVGDDVLGQLDSFDPREYFPEMFSEFGALLSSHVDEITPHWEKRESVRWRMLEQFYKVDLARFVKDR